MSEGHLNFSMVQPLVDLSFWLKFTQKKLDEWKLDCPQIDIFGDPLGPVASAPIETKSKKSKNIKEKKSKRTESTNQNSSDNSGSGTNVDWDPFA